MRKKGKNIVQMEKGQKRLTDSRQMTKKRETGRKRRRIKSAATTREWIEMDKGSQRSRSRRHEKEEVREAAC